MENFEKKVLEQLQEIQEILDGTLNKKNDFTVTSRSEEGITYTHDRESYLQLGMEVATEQLQFLIEDIQERVEKKNRFKIIK